MSKIKIFGAIEKVDSQEDGTIIVHGVASTEAEDSQGEVVKADAMRAAIPDYMKFGAVREMHQPLAAGTALKCEVGDDNITRLQAHIVDPTAVKKVLNNVYKGFSIGGKVNKRDELNKNTITQLSLTEISLVDRPANPEAVLSFGKVEGVDDEPVKKAGARFSKATKAELEAMHKAVADVNERFSKLGYAAMKADDEDEDDGGKPGDHTEPDGDEMKDKEKAALVDSLKKSQTSYEELQKAHADTTAKLSSLTEELAKAQTAIAEKDAEILKLKAQPAPAKGNVTVVHKTGDVPPSSNEVIVEPIRKGDGSIDDLATSIKAIHRGAAR